MVSIKDWEYFFDFFLVFLYLEKFFLRLYVREFKIVEYIFILYIYELILLEGGLLFIYWCWGIFILLRRSWSKYVIVFYYKCSLIVEIFGCYYFIMNFELILW